MKEANEITLAELLQALQQFWHYLLRKWYVLLLVGFLGGVVGVLYATVTKPKYQSKMSFALEESGGALSGAISLAAEFGLNIGSGSRDIFSGDNILAILTSRKIVEQTLLTVDTLSGKPLTMANYWLQVHKSSKIDKDDKDAVIDFPVGMPISKFSYLQDSILFVIQKSVVESIIANRRDKKLNVFDISYTSPDERFTKVMTERLVQQTIEYYTELRTRRSLKLLNNLEARVSEMKGSAQGAIRGRAQIQDANVNPALAEQGSQLQIKQLDASVYGAAYTELFKNLEMARYQFLNDVPLLQIIDEARYPMKRIKPGRLKTGIIVAFGFGFLAILALAFLYKRRN